MEPLYSFFQFLHKFVELSEDEFDAVIAPFLVIRKFNKKELITEAGETEDYLNYIVTGLGRKYYRKNDQEIVTQLAMEGQLLHAEDSFHSRTPSEFTLEAIEPTVVVSLHYNDLETIYATSSKMERLGRLIITLSMVLKDRWQLNMARMTPRERFLDFVVRNPELLQRVPQKYLASYLNIQPETFSRFKHLLRERRSGV